MAGYIDSVETTKGIPTNASVVITVDGAPKTVKLLLSGVEPTPVPGDHMDVLYLRVGDGYHVVAADEDLGARSREDGPYVAFFAVAGVWVGLLVAGLRRGRRPKSA